MLCCCVEADRTMRFSLALNSAVLPLTLASWVLALQMCSTTCGFSFLKYLERYYWIPINLLFTDKEILINTNPYPKFSKLYFKVFLLTGFPQVGPIRNPAFLLIMFSSYHFLITHSPFDDLTYLEIPIIPQICLIVWCSSWKLSWQWSDVCFLHTRPSLPMGACVQTSIVLIP